MILIPNREEEIFRQLDGRITSRLKSAPKIRFDQYSLTELVSIRSDRVKWGFRSDAIDDDGIRRIADLAAGDARVAIIRQSALSARQQSRDEITTDAIEDAAPEAKQVIRQRNEEKLTPHQEVLYEVIDTRGEVAPGHLYQEYADRV